MKAKILWGIIYVLAAVSFVSLLSWMFMDSTPAKWVCIISMVIQVYGILTMEGQKKS